MGEGKRILLVVSGGIAAYKCPDLVRRLRERGYGVRCVLTQGGAQFVTPLALGAVSGDTVYQDLFSLTDESEMGHIRLSREADLVLVAPATANIIAAMAAGLAGDLATTVLLATDKPVMIAPAMNVRMWEHPATRANVTTLRNRGIGLVGPEAGDMACGETGMGRMSDPNDIVAAVDGFFRNAGRLAGRKAVITSGPTFEAIDPVRFIGNHSSGKQGHAIAAALAHMGAQTTLVTGPTAQPDPSGVSVIHVRSAREMHDACLEALPADIAVCAAAVADWRVADEAAQKIKKGANAAPPSLTLIPNPDILAALAAAGNKRPRLVVGFAAETENVVENATAKRARKGCDWIVANDVSPSTGTFGGDANAVHLIDGEGAESWPLLSKEAVAERLATRIAERLEEATP
ncbi:MAG: bifunctional phosphopantothenoylcysteine decarboxylase/phosphopantothenate--cysteine ligase CoaBC [Rhodospirillales bacterium]|nr:bifunctional phosphopantothenoylcysteine decarboxylase/phosphopantothenate--cysteine ligase CoaBC [Rhodospirillales bacterium]MCW8860967.1 bifunctional phosphopantothenoylcysteine decarboxylase/phosphopantothenate--cysteine ligase CoaBC [Rhodospirillales bacterium]MCW8953098.1 bifunctional phosphopantothenoylcysteine decarboxylase/phosphopantothenate--cysteine ligase CoaBC [Rhodospirillales bacterium]MCW8971617.1 bifunctional phosphopantothenoylcysteine decarboxylase/phosphopantothenate--cyst